jgi:hypothetical protein
MIYAKYPKLQNKISLTPNYNLDRNEHLKFTNLLTLVEVNKILIKLSNYKESKFSSPTHEERETIYKIVAEFYDFIFDNIEDYKRYFKEGIALNKFRNSAKGEPLNLLFLPVGLTFIAELYLYFKKAKKLDIFKLKINLLNFDLYTGHYKNIFFNPIQNKVIPSSHKSLAKSLTLYLLGETISETDEELKKKLAKAYNINELSSEFTNLTLPSKLQILPK